MPSTGDLHPTGAPRGTAMILTIDFRRWIRAKGLSHRTRHVYLNLLVLTNATPQKPLDLWRSALGLKLGQWHATKGELRQAGLLRAGQLLQHPAVTMTERGQ